MNAIVIGAIIGVIVGMVKKKGEGFAWQHTLEGSRAVQWLKPSITFNPVRMSFASGEVFASQGWSTGDWNKGKECILLFEADPASLPLLIASRGVVGYFQTVAQGWHDAGGTVVTQHGVDTVSIPDAAKRMVYMFDRGPGQFDPYYVLADEAPDN